MEWYKYQCELYNYNEHIRKKKILALLVLKYALTRQKRFHVRDIYLKRRQQGFYHNLIQEMRLGDREQYFNFHRMSVQKFDALLNLVAPSLTKSTLLREDVISTAERLSITLRYLASGDSMASLSFAFRASRSSISNIVKETCDVLWEVLASKVLKQPTEPDWLVIAERFFTQWNFPNCIGAIDGKHVVIQAPNNAGSLYYNYKGAHSLVLLAICDADYCLTLVDIGASGRQSDGGVLTKSLFGQALQQDMLDIPPPKLIQGSEGCVTPHLLVADAAFPMSNKMMRPYPQKGLSEEKRIFNYRLSRARRVIENVFGIIAARWRIFRKPIIGKLENIECMIKAICCLHNYLQKGDQALLPRERRYCPANFVDREGVDGALIPGDWRQEIGQNDAMQPLGRMGTNTYSKSAEQTRQNLASYFVGEGQVPWQRRQAGLE